MQKAKISILIMTYNQEKSIGKAIDSAVMQTLAPYEIIVSDDCSTDATWQIIQEKQQKTPSLIKISRNHENLGIYGNYEKLKSLCNGDIVCLLAGDDTYRSNLTTVLQDCVTEQNINLDSKYIIVTNNMLIRPDGRERVWDNYAERNKSHFGMKLRYGLSYRSIGMSRALVVSCTSTATLIGDYPELGYMVDMLKGLEEVSNAENIYFKNAIVCAYNVGLGVTSKPSAKDNIELLNYINLIRKTYHKKLIFSDRLYLAMLEALTEHAEKRSMKSFFWAIGLWMINFNNCSRNTPWVFHLKHLIPYESKNRVKRLVLPLFMRKSK